MDQVSSFIQNVTASQGVEQLAFKDIKSSYLSDDSNGIGTSEVSQYDNGYLRKCHILICFRCDQQVVSTGIELSVETVFLKPINQFGSARKTPEAHRRHVI